MGQIDLRIDSVQLEPEQGRGDKADALPEVTGSAVTDVGDLWLLGHHRVVCGSALEPESYARLMQDKPAAMVFTDPPYNVPIQGHVSGLGAVRHREFAMACGR